MFEVIRHAAHDLVLRGRCSTRSYDVKGFDASAFTRVRTSQARHLALRPGQRQDALLEGAASRRSALPLREEPQTITERSRRFDIFVRARSVAPRLLVLEDLETIGGDANRSFFLNELDGFSENTGVAVLATTNYPERIDPAIIDRPSRFDRKYLFDLPSTDERLAYLERWARGLEAELRPSQDRLARTADTTRDFSFAYLKELTISATIAWVRTARAGGMDAVLEEVVGTLKPGEEGPLARQRCEDASVLIRRLTLAVSAPRLRITRSLRLGHPSAPRRQAWTPVMAA
jgi:hypothetical protein